MHEEGIDINQPTHELSYFGCSCVFQCKYCSMEFIVIEYQVNIVYALKKKLNIFYLIKINLLKIAYQTIYTSIYIQGWKQLNSMEGLIYVAELQLKLFLDSSFLQKTKQIFILKTEAFNTGLGYLWEKQVTWSVEMMDIAPWLDRFLVIR